MANKGGGFARPNVCSMVPGPVLQGDHAAVEPALVDQIEVELHICWEGARATTNDHGGQVQMAPIDQVGSKRLSRQRGAGDRGGE